MYLYAEIEKKQQEKKNNKSKNIQYAIKLNFYLGLLRIHKEFPILSV